MRPPKFVRLLCSKLTLLKRNQFQIVNGIIAKTCNRILPNGNNLKKHIDDYLTGFENKKYEITVEQPANGIICLHLWC